MLDPSMTLFGKRFQVNSDGLVQVEDSPRRNLIKETSVEKSKSDEHLDDQVHKEVTEEEEESMENEEGDVSWESTSEKAERKQDEKEASVSKKELKKPDKILACPRCNSMDTKFCYYNNYNVNQPRHFCKNCQRYWTAGGTMRSVPVGAGRRKNKTCPSRYTHLTISHSPHLSNSTVLTFGVDNADDRSTASTVTTSSSIEDPPKQPFINGFTNQMPCFQWPYMWNPFYPSAFPMPIYPHPYWNAAPFPCNVPWAPTPTLGKHTRDGEIKSPSHNDRSSQTSSTTNTTNTVLIPKTLRIDDPDEAAKSSIWTTLGINKDKGDPIRKGFFNTFQSKGAEKNACQVEAAPALFKANPVALCRSFSFQERA